MNTPIQLIKCMFDGAVSAVQGYAGMINTAFKSVLYGTTVGADGVIEYGTNYTDLAQFLFTVGGIALGVGAAWFFLRLLKRRGA